LSCRLCSVSLLNHPFLNRTKKFVAILRLECLIYFNHVRAPVPINQSDLTRAFSCD
jgi:hypothetical protein